MGFTSRFGGIVAVCLLLTIVSTVTAKYSGGTGEPNDPYQIATAADLISLGETPEDYDKHFLLTADIDLDPNLPGRKVFDKAVIAPAQLAGRAGPRGTPFTGVFDGNGHAISHLTIEGGDFLGLFGVLESGAEVRNLGVVDANIMSLGAHVGAVVGSSGWWFFAGGTITHCYSTGEVKGTADVGGLMGLNDGQVTGCWSGGIVNASEGYAGGLISENLGSIANSYSVAAVSGDSTVGGLVGANSGDVVRCYSVGGISASGQYVGGLVGCPWVEFSLLEPPVFGDARSCFWDTQTSGQATSGAGTGKTTAEMQMAGTFLDVGWDFVGETGNGSEDVWKIDEGLGYPRLTWEKYSGGSGTAQDPYQIATAADLIALGSDPNDYDKHFILTADIDLDPNLPGGRVFDKAVISPDTWICSDRSCWRQGTSFTGVFDGNYHRISHLTIEGGWLLGLFGELASGAEVTSLGVADVNIIGSWGSGDIGGLAGENAGTVTYCYSTGKVAGDHKVGGLVGNNLGQVARCHATGAVSGDHQYVGGLVGWNEGEVTYCSSTCAVTAYGSTGGLVGGNTGMITASYAKGDVTGISDAGGLVGRNGDCLYSPWEHCFPGVIFNCYSASVLTEADIAGGLVGCNIAGQIYNSFWDTQSSGQATSDGGGTGKTTAEMQTAATFLDAGWDFVGETVNGTEDIWWILEGQDYPRLWWEARTE